MQTEVFDLSVVIPSYNSAEWLPSTLSAVEKAIRSSTLRCEIIVIDDGSTDDTRAVVMKAQSEFATPILLCTQPNLGRFLARWRGATEARASLMMLLDSRVLLGPTSLKHIQLQRATSRESDTWNAHIETDPDSPLVGRFWEVPTFVFWGAYLSHPRALDITLKNFDTVPKGTTCLILPTELFRDACVESWPTGDSRLASDDTKLLRYIVGRKSLRLDPAFSAVYRPRTTVQTFLSHAFTRGTMFVDSYAGTGLIRNLVIIALSLALPMAMALLIILITAASWVWLSATCIFSALLVAAPAVVAAARLCAGRAIASYLIYVVPFTLVFWAGLARGVIVHRRAFIRSSPQVQKVAP